MHSATKKKSSINKLKYNMVQEFCYRRIQVYCKMKCSQVFSYKWNIQSQSAMGGRKVITGNSSCMPPVTAKKKKMTKK